MHPFPPQRRAFRSLLHLSLTLMLIACCMASPAIGTALETIDSFDTPGRADARAVASAGEFIYLGTQANAGQAPEFYVLRAKENGETEVVSTLDLDLTINALAVVDDRAYLGTTEHGRALLILDVSDPAAPRIIGSHPSQSINAIVVQNDIAFLGMRRETREGLLPFSVLSVDNPSRPLLLGGFDVSHDVNDLAISEDRVYLATGSHAQELLVLSISDPSAIEQADAYDAPGKGGGKALAIDGGHVYLATGSNGDNGDLLIFDADPLVLRSSLDLGGVHTDLVIHEGVAYLSDSSPSMLNVLDVRRPATPRVLQAVNTSGMVDALAAERGRLLCASRHNSAELQIIDIDRVIPPNVIVVMTDDQRWDTLQYMPQVRERLADRGVDFTNSFVTTSMCCPSRATFLSGLFPHNHGVINNARGVAIWKESGQDHSTLATWLKASGYRTGLFGKYMASYSDRTICPKFGTRPCYVPPGWDVWNAFRAQSYYDYDLTDSEGNRTRYGSAEEDYSTDVLAQKAVQFIRESRDEPFFLYLSVHAPHGDSPFLAKPARRHQIYPMIPIHEIDTPNYFEEDLSDKPDWIQGLPREGEDPNRVTPQEAARFFQVSQVRSLFAVDDAVAALDDELERLGLAEDTIFIFTSDNGHSWGEHRLIGKVSAFEESIRVPLVVRYPRKVSSAREEPAQVMSVDVTATILDLVGAEPIDPRPGATPPSLDGESFASLLIDPNAEWARPWIFLELTPNPGTETSPVPISRYSGIRVRIPSTGAEWKYIEYPESGEEELYNLNEDPYELESLHASMEPRDLFAKAVLKFVLEQLKAQ